MTEGNALKKKQGSGEGRESASRKGKCKQEKRRGHWQEVG